MVQNRCSQNHRSPKVNTVKTGHFRDQHLQNEKDVSKLAFSQNYCSLKIKALPKLKLSQQYRVSEKKQVPLGVSTKALTTLFCCHCFVSVSVFDLLFTCCLLVLTCCLLVVDLFSKQYDLPFTEAMMMHTHKGTWFWSKKEEGDFTLSLVK